MMRNIVTLAFMTVTTMWKPDLKLLHATYLQLALYCLYNWRCVWLHDQTKSYQMPL